MFAYLCVSFGLFAVQPVWLMPPLACLTIGASAALVTRAAWATASLGAGLGILGGALAAPPIMSESGGWGMRLTAALGLALAGALSAAAVAWWLRRPSGPPQRELIASIALLVLVVAGMWGTADALNRGVYTGTAASLYSQLSERPNLGDTAEDHKVYLRLYYDLREGEPYYDSYLRIFLADSSRYTEPPPGIFGYRLPTIFYVWLLVPSAQYLPWAFLLFATLAVASAYSIALQLARPGTAVLAPLAVAPAYLYLAATTYVLFVDGWGMAVTLAGMALFVASVRRQSRTLLWAAAATMLLGALLREILIYPVLLAAASCLLVPRGKRLRAALPWLGAAAIFVAAYLAHAVAVDGRVAPGRGASFWLHGGLSHLVATVRFFEFMYGAAPWFLAVATVIGVVGAALVVRTDRQVGAFMIAATAVPLAAFLVLGNGGVLIRTGDVLGYWGILVVPTALSLIPVAFDWVLVKARIVGPLAS